MVFVHAVLDFTDANWDSIAFSSNYCYQGLCVQSGELLRLHRTVQCEAIARGLMQHLGEDECHSREGKMYGVLLVETLGGEKRVLKAFSGLLNGSSHVPGWVTPIPGRDRVALTEARTLTELESMKQELMRLQQLPQRQEYDRRLREWELELEALGDRHKICKQERVLTRDLLCRTLVGETLKIALEELNQASRLEGIERRQLKRERDDKLQPLKQLIEAADGRITELKQQRKKLSRELQMQMHEAYTLVNFLGNSRSLQQLMPSGSIPTGTGDCCAPKLLHYAALHNLKPLAMAEFWWGPSLGDKVQGEFYGACGDRCQPLMGFLLSGLAQNRSVFKNVNNCEVDAVGDSDNCEHPDYVRAKHDRRQFISSRQRFTAVMLRPYEYICQTQMHPDNLTSNRLFRLFVLKSRSPLTPLKKGGTRNTLKVPMIDGGTTNNLKVLLNDGGTTNNLKVLLNDGGTTNNLKVLLNDGGTTNNLKVLLNDGGTTNNLKVLLNDGGTTNNLKVLLNDGGTTNNLKVLLNDGGTTNNLKVLLNDGGTTNNLKVPLNNEGTTNNLKVPLNNGGTTNNLKVPLNNGGTTNNLKVPMIDGGTTNNLKVPLIKGDLGGSRLDKNQHLFSVLSSHESEHPGKEMKGGLIAHPKNNNFDGGIGILPVPEPRKMLPIIYEDKWLIIINKPANLLSVPGRYLENQDSVLSRFRNLLVDGFNLNTVHRLDFDTSGILILARDQETYRKLSLQFEKKQVKKVYESILSGGIDIKFGSIALPLWGNPDNRPIQEVNWERGKPSVTEFQVIGREGNCSRIEFVPLTGRTHQLRVHAADVRGLGIPILGDRLYGCKADGMRLHLHAREISFEHPQLGNRLYLKAEMPF
ncbi:MAG: pseudouridine synthase [Microcoleus anatoxicus]|uniref:RluA family pseudouridine synthase n=1 Tax=Microcoleus anatoxicus TaxID=2705319 RepID=UPI00366D3267